MVSDEIASLVKFCNCDTGLAVLNSQTLRWSSPHLFNDPFEADHNYSPGINAEILQKGLTKEALNMLFGPSDPAAINNRLVTAISRWRDEDRFASEEEAEQVLKQLLNQVAERQQQDIDKFLSTWQQLTTALRICSFSDKPDNISCWQRFADNHRGIALRFAAGEGTGLKDPRRLSYKKQPTQITSLKQQVNVAYGFDQAPSTEEFIHNFLVKNKDNQSEREWRCFGSELGQKDDPLLWYNDKKFIAAELKAVYLGVSTDQKTRDAVTKTIKDNYSKTKIYQAQIVTGEYALELSPLN